MRVIKILLVITFWVYHSSAYVVLPWWMENQQPFRVHAEGLNFNNEDSLSFGGDKWGSVRRLISIIQPHFNAVRYYK